MSSETNRPNDSVKMDATLPPMASRNDRIACYVFFQCTATWVQNSSYDGMLMEQSYCSQRAIGRRIRQSMINTPSREFLPQADPLDVDIAGFYVNSFDAERTMQSFAANGYKLPHLN
ncbi:hypothetical protein H257_04151 [Aphanomyces astaci]|uniref:Uncharacterized protein n=1 Tax=Aphanomyces astaci TaxID=112090 RepID=W4GWL5_APHAT|nr:hypothetical protein H257_04151 [Aphanomyces astaci]ETV83424.1 hypothetical protein H257_04151 [Aphanomyces astaci]|eukprot:XP_009826854.1 hypothetical protein H257_04151 [Aphanomyces astaci]